jgi:hypothetical protein
MARAHQKRSVSLHNRGATGLKIDGLLVILATRLASIIKGTDSPQRRDSQFR